MKIAIIGAGFTGMASAQKLIFRGHDVTIFEKGSAAGGLAQGFKHQGWSWPLEQHYHHLFTSDRSIIVFARWLGVKVDFRRPVTSTYIDEGIFQIDSPVNLLKFSKLNIIDRLRVGVTILYLKITPFWKPLEGVPAHKFLKATMGIRAWSVLWEPLFKKKFGKKYLSIPASWFWARIKKRSASLGYPRGGFQNLIEKAVKKNKASGGVINFRSEVSSISKHGAIFELIINGKKHLFDKVVCTLPSNQFIKITKGLPESYRRKLSNLKGIGAINLVLELKKQFLTDGSYWLNINDMDYPFLCVVEHTNYINKSHYGGKRIIYLGNYLPSGHHCFSANSKTLIKEFLPYLQRINPDFKRSWISKSFLFKAAFAQSLVTLNYSKRLPELSTPIKGLCLANIQQIYPWDRGTNYSVELGYQVAELIG